MTDGDALLRAVCEHPRDDLPRLVYADWLDDHGQPDRAAFIRTEVDIYSRPEWDAGRVRYERAAASVHRGWEDLPWAKEATAALPRWCRWGFWPMLRRGFPWSVQVLDGWKLFGPTAAPLFDRFPIEHLTLDHVRDLARLAAQPWAGHLTAFGWRDGRAGPGPVTAFGESPHLAGLRHLDLAHGSVSEDGLVALTRTAAFRGLTALSAGLSPRFAQVLLEQLGGEPRLTSLSLHGVQLGDLGFELLFTVETVSGLRFLNLGSTGLNLARVQTLAGTVAFAGLRHLVLSGNGFGNAGVAAIVASPHLADLAALDLTFCQVGDDGVRAILLSPLADRLVMLDLTGSPASAVIKQELKARMGDRVRV